jgi:hypothetical protein
VNVGANAEATSCVVQPNPRLDNPRGRETLTQEGLPFAVYAAPYTRLHNQHSLDMGKGRGSNRGGQVEDDRSGQAESGVEVVGRWRFLCGGDQVAEVARVQEGVGDRWSSALSCPTSDLSPTTRPPPLLDFPLRCGVGNSCCRLASRKRVTRLCEVMGKGATFSEFRDLTAVPGGGRLFSDRQ